MNLGERLKAVLEGKAVHKPISLFYIKAMNGKLGLFHKSDHHCVALAKGDPFYDQQDNTYEFYTPQATEEDKRKEFVEKLYLALVNGGYRTAAELIYDTFEVKK